MNQDNTDTEQPLSKEESLRKCNELHKTLLEVRMPCRVKTAKQQQTFVRSCKLTKNFPFPPPFPFCCCTSSASKRPKEACVTKKPNCSGTVTVKHEVHRHCNSIGKKYLGLIKFFQRSTPGTTNTNIHSKKEGYRVRIRFSKRW